MSTWPREAFADNVMSGRACVLVASKFRVVCATSQCMNARKIRELAEERAGFGYSRQHIFDELTMQYPGEKPEQLAKVVRYVPSEAARSHFKSYHQALLACIIGYGVLQLIRPLLAGEFDSGSWTSFRLMPFATIFLGIAVFRYRGEVLPWLAFINGLTAFAVLNDLSELAKGSVDPWEFGQHLLSLAIAGLAWYLSVHMYPKYTVDKDPLGNAPPRILFPPEPGMYRM